jgi:hypothetical protein
MFTEIALTVIAVLLILIYIEVRLQRLNSDNFYSWADKYFKELINRSANGVNNQGIDSEKIVAAIEKNTDAVNRLKPRDPNVDYIIKDFDEY